MADELIPLRRVIVGVIRNCKTTDTTEGRSDLFNELPEKVRQRIRESGKPLKAVNSMVDICLENPDWMQALVEAIEYLEGGSIVCTEPLRKLWESLKPVLKERTIKAGYDYPLIGLWTLVWEAGLGDEDLLNLYHQARPEGFNDGLSRPQGAGALITGLRGMPRQSGLHPLQHFVELLGRAGIPAETAGKLRSWNEANLEALGSSRRKLEAVRAGVSPTGEGTAGSSDDDPFSLLVELKPDTNNQAKVQGKLYTVTIGLWRTPGKYRTLFVSDQDTPDEKVMTLDRLGAKLRELISTRLSPAESKAMRIEFFLDLDDLSLDVEMLDYDEFSKLGDLVPVIVRWLNHATHPVYLGNLVPQWDRIASFADSLRQGIPTQRPPAYLCTLPGEEPTYLCCQPGETPPRDTTPAILLFAYKPHPDDRQRLSQKLKLGLPAAIWPRPCRDCVDADELIAELQALLADDQLASLPKTIHEIRKKAATTDPANYLTLLWNDPRRMPKRTGNSNRLAAPTARGRR